jgi:hypothetical protein
MTINGWNLRLEQTAPQHFPAVHRALNSRDISRTWRTRGRPVPSQDLETVIFDGVALSYTAMDQGGKPLALVQVVGYQPQDRFADLAVLRLIDTVDGSAVASAVLGLDQAFDHLDLRKIYFKTSDAASASIASAMSRFLVTEGVLQKHLWMGGEYVDVTITSLTKASFGELLRTTPLARSIEPAEGWRCLDGSPPPEAFDWAHFERLVASLPTDDNDNLIDLDSMALLEVMAALDDLAGHEVDIRAVTSLSGARELLELGHTIRQSNPGRE